MLYQFYSNDLDTSEAPAFLGCFKRPVSCASRGWETVNNSQAVKSPGEPVRQARSYQRGFELKHPFQMQTITALS